MTTNAANAAAENKPVKKSGRPKGNAKYSAQLSIKLPPEAKKELEELADEMGVLPGALVRQTIIEMLKKHRKEN